MEDHFALKGWSLDAVGADVLDMSTTAFDGAGKTLFAIWEAYVVPGVRDEWDISNEALQSLIDEAVAGNGVIVIDFTNIDDLSMLILPLHQLAAINDKNAELTVAISLPKGTISLSANALASLVEQAGVEDIMLTLYQPSTASVALTNNQRNAIGPNDEVFRITLEKAGSGERITEFDGLLTITLPWNGAFPAIVWHLANDGFRTRMQTTYNETAKTVTFVTNHLSIYIIRSAWLPSQSTNRFVDVPNAPNWQNAAVSWADRNRITTGSPASSNTFKPDDPVTRAEYVTFLHRIFGSPSALEAPFSDMPVNVSFRNAISWALEEGITTGSPRGGSTFKPMDNITREEIATMLHRYIGGEILAPDSLDGYTDHANISTWEGAREAVNWAVYNEIMGVNINWLNPRGNATRAEAITMLYRVVVNFNITP